MTIPTLNQDSSTGIVYAGLSFHMTAQLAREGRARDVSTSTLTAQLLTSDRSTALCAPVALDSDASGASWPVGKVVVLLSPTDTVKAVDPDMVLQIVETDSDDNMWPYTHTVHGVQGVPNV